MAFIYSLADTWNDGATTFKGISLNVTDSASAAGSLLMDLQVGGVSQFNVSKSGIVRLASQANIGANASPAGFGSGPNTGLYFSTGNWLGLQVNNNAMWAWNGANPQFIQPSSGGLCWSSGAYPGFNALNVDLILARDAANTLAQRNGVNAQAFNLYNTYTDASNYERGFMRWSTNVLTIGSEAAGTGVARALGLRSATTNINLDGNGLAWNTSGRGIGMGLTGAPGSYNVIQSAGNISLWHASGDTVTIREATGFTNGARLAFTGSGNSIQALLSTQNTGVLRLSGATDGATLEFTEQTAPSAASANSVRIYAEDDGAGKTRLMARFATGAAVQIAIEP